MKLIGTEERNKILSFLLVTKFFHCCFILLPSLPQGKLLDIFYGSKC